MLAIVAVTLAVPLTPEFTELTIASAVSHLNETAPELLASVAGLSAITCPSSAPRKQPGRAYAWGCGKKCNGAGGYVYNGGYTDVHCSCYCQPAFSPPPPPPPEVVPCHNPTSTELSGIHSQADANQFCYDYAAARATSPAAIKGLWVYNSQGAYRCCPKGNWTDTSTPSTWTRLAGKGNTVEVVPNSLVSVSTGHPMGDSGVPAKAGGVVPCMNPSASQLSNLHSQADANQFCYDYTAALATSAAAIKGLWVYNSQGAYRCCPKGGWTDTSTPSTWTHLAGKGNTVEVKVELNPISTGHPLGDSGVPAHT